MADQVCRAYGYTVVASDRIPSRARIEGYYGFRVTFRAAHGGEHAVEVDMPGVPLDENDGCNPLSWPAPRVYINGNSWTEDFAIRACERERVLGDAPSGR